MRLFFYKYFLLSLLLLLSVKSISQCAITPISPIPPTLPVGVNCTAILDWSPNPTFVPAVPGSCSVISSSLFSISNGYNRGSVLPLNATVTITYQIVTSQGVVFNDFVVTTKDVTIPVISNVPPNITVTCALPTAPTSLPATDNCNTSVTSAPYIGQTPTTFNPCTNATYTRKWQVSDGLGNTATATQVITYQKDGVAPTINTALPANITITCNVTPPAPLVLTQADVSDNCPGPLTITYKQDTANRACKDKYWLVRTWSVTDACGNSKTGTQRIVVTTPVLTFATPPSDLSLSCDGNTNISAAINSWYMNNAGAIVTPSLCGSTIVFNNDTIPSKFKKCNGTGVDSTRISATDGCSTVSKFAKVTIVDNTAPVWTINPTNLAISCNNIVDPPSLINTWLTANGNGVANDFCGGTKITHTPVNLKDCNGTGTNSITFTATDSCGNFSTRTALLTVVDTTPPYWDDIPSDITISCDANFAANVQAYYTSVGINGVAIDYCSKVTYDVDTVSIVNACGSTGVLKIAFNAIDDCGNKSTEFAKLTIIDTTKPVFVKPPQNIVVQCNGTSDPQGKIAAWIANHGNATATDACDNTLTWTHNFNINTLTVGCKNSPAPVTVCFTASDDCLNTRSSCATISLLDTVPPYFKNTLTNKIKSCDGTNFQADLNTWISTAGGLQVADSCSMNVVFDDFSFTTVSGISGVGTLSNGPYPIIDSTLCDWNVTITFIARDQCGNTGTKTGIFSIVDKTAPVLDPPPADITVACDMIPPQIDVLANDNCHNINLVYTIKDVKDTVCINQSLKMKRIWTVTDICNNSSSTFQTITLIDNVKPIISATPADTNVNCQSIPTPPSNITVLDNCDATIKLIFTQTSTQIASPDSCGHYNYVITRKWSATDICGNVSIKVQNINVEDFEEPNFTVNSGGTYSCELYLDTAITGSPRSITDNCDFHPKISFTDFKYDITPCKFSIFRTWKVVDACSNPAYGVQTLTVIDTTKPRITTPKNDTILFCKNDALLETEFLAWVNNHGNQKATDNCNPADSLRWYALVPGSYSINDSTTFTSTVGVLDAPNCATPNLGIYRFENVDFVVLDKCGNSNVSSCSFTVKDTTKPTLTNCPTNTTINNGTGICGANYFFFPPTVSDDCNFDINTISLKYKINSGAYQSNVPANNSIFASLSGGQNIITFLVTDCSGNSNTCSFSINVVDNTPPTIACPADMTVNVNNTNCTSLFNLPSLTSYADNCTAQSSAIMQFSMTGANVLPMQPFVTNPLVLNTGNSVIKYTVADNSNNSSTCTFKLKVIDMLPPTATCQNISININPSGDGIYTLLPSEVNNGSNDNCTNVSLSVLPNTFTCTNAGTIVPVTLTVKDTFNNTSTCISNVTVQNIKPVPSYNLGLCTNQNLVLMPNPPAITAPNVFTYMWTGPNGFASTLENPMIPNATTASNGLYAVKITGPTGCTSLGTVNVNLSNTPNTPPISAIDSSLCTGQQLTLQTQAYSGTLVKYYWYNGNVPGTLLSTTTLPTYTITPTLGTQKYYVLVEVDACTSTASSVLEIHTFNNPIAVINPDSMSVCEQSALSLNTVTTGSQYLYKWTGPNAFTSNVQNPLVTNTASTTNAGTYSLVVTENGCNSTPATLRVKVKTKPATPIITGKDTVCFGGILTLNATNNGDQYQWTNPAGATINTSIGQLISNNATTTSSGNWQVQSILNGCTSNVSASYKVLVLPQIVLTATNNSPVCSGTNVQLRATSNTAGTINWTGPSGFTSTVQNPNILAIAGTYTFKLTTTNGCKDSAKTIVTVENRPFINSITSNAPACASSSTIITLTPNLSAPDPGTHTYKWTGPNGFTATTAVATITNPTLTVNGIYTLIVTNAFGCASAASNKTISINLVPNTPVLTFSNDTVCEGGKIKLTTSTFTGSNVSYTWQLANKPSSNTLVPELNLDSIKISNGGIYSVSVSANGCVSSKSNEKTLVVDPLPSKPLISSNTPLCIGDSLKLNTLAIQNKYNWTGPNGFNSSMKNPIVSSVTLSNSGKYNLITESTFGCKSPISDSMVVIVKTLPIKPIISTISPICKDAPGSIITLTINNNTAVTGAKYSWYLGSSNNSIAGAVTTTNTLISNISGFTPGTKKLFAITTFDGCNSATSDTIDLMLDEVPNILASAGSDIDQCINQTLKLNATNPTKGTGNWTLVSGNGLNILNPNSNTTSLTGYKAGQNYSLAWTLSNGACKDYNRDTVVVKVKGLTVTPNAPDTLRACGDNSTVLEGNNPPANVIGFWTQSPVQSQIGVVIVNPNSKITNVTGLISGNTYFFNWNFVGQECNDTLSKQVAVTYQNLEKSNGGNDTLVCNGSNSMQLKGIQGTLGTGTWSSLDTSVMIKSPNSPTTEIVTQKSGIYALVWSLSNANCGVFSRDTVLINNYAAPMAKEDTIKMSLGGSGKINILNNDIYQNGVNATIIQSPTKGVAILKNNNEISFDANNNFAGLDRLRYKICAELCPNLCSEADVVFNVDGLEECRVPSLMTPNGDGINDYFIVPCLFKPEFKNNSLVVINQWGGEVYQAAPYSNDWEGTFKNEKLPSGTYFYFLDYGDGSKVKKGFIVIER